MANIYKIEAYIVDHKEEFANGEQCFEQMINHTNCFCPVPIKHQDVSFEWNDNLKINYIGCTEKDCEEYFYKNVDWDWMDK